MTLLCAGVLLATLLPGCASDADAGGPSEDDIQGGQASRSYLAVGMVRLPDGTFGTGSLIRKDVVLTAGHVAMGPVERFYYGSPPAGKVADFKNLPSSKIVATALGDCYAHPAANGHPAAKLGPACVGSIDIGMVKLDKAITDVTPLRLYEGGWDWLWNAFDKAPNATAVGFGCHTAADKKTIVTGERRSATSVVDFLTPMGMWAVAGTGLASTGDAGGPLLYNGLIIGTVVGPIHPAPAGPDTCRQTEQEYTRIDAARTWIKAQLKAWGAL